MESTATANTGAEARRLASSLQAPSRRKEGVVPFQSDPLYLRKDFRQVIEAKIADVPNWDREKVLDFLAKSPFEIDPAAWDKENVPESMRDEIHSALKEFMFRVRLFKECLDRSQTPTIAEYVKNPDCKRVFDGCIVYLDLADSSKLSGELSPAQLRDLIENVFHEFVLVATGLFRFMKDVVVGDAVSGPIMAPAGNKRVSAIEGARLLLTVCKLFEHYNKIVENIDRVTGEKHYPLKIRGAMASGRVEIMTSDLASEMVCRLMNLVARMSGIPGKMELIVNKEAKELLETFFNFKEVKTIDVLHEEIARLKAAIDAIPDNGTDGALVKRLEMHYRLSRVYEVLYKVFELPNHDGNPSGTPYLDAFKEHRNAYLRLRDTSDLYKTPALEQAVNSMVEEADKDYYSEKFQKVESKHLKGFKAEDYKSMYLLVGYKEFMEDELVNPKRCLFRELFLDEVPAATEGLEEGARKSRIERYVERVAKEHHISLRADLNLGSSHFIMTTVQPSGSPDFAYQQACRAVGMALYGIERMKRNWARQPSGFIGRVQADLIEKEVFSEDGKVNEEKLSEYLEEAVVLPCLLREVSQVHVCRRNGNRGSVNMVGQVLAMHRGDIINEDEKDRVLHLNVGSAEELEAANERMKNDYNVENFYSLRTIAVIKSLDYSKKWQDVELELGSAADAIAAEFCRIAGLTQARLKPKTYRYATVEPVEWGEDMFRDIDGNNGNIHPFVRATCRELFSVGKEQQAA